MTAELPPLPPLAVSDFGDFFSALWTTPDGDKPPTAFEWQQDLVEQLERERVWPGLIDLPTGTGKTSLLEIALFLQALDAERDPADRWMPRRVVLVVDRRVVVDQADDRGRTVARRLAAASEDDGAVGRVASRLRHLSNASDGEPPVVTSVLRGGIVRDESWARRPDVPALISSTVDQVGSRLLFRGYGISPSMRPVHAGLLANDCLFLLDEVHLARPFAQTLAAVADQRARAEREATPRSSRWHVVELSATPTRAAALKRFPAKPLDPGSHVVLRRRLLARKPARLESVALPAHAGEADRLFADACSDALEGLLRTPDVTAIGAIVNRVSTARAVAEKLVERVATDGSDGRVADILLLTGRMRPVDRDRFLDQHRARLEMGRERSTDARPLVVVATQCIEAGADFDLDAIVTECASLDALRQRFGRVDRDGQRSVLGAELTSVILVRGPSVAGGAEPDPVYGGALATTWAWLNGVSDQSSELGAGPHVDFGIRRLPVPSEAVLAQLVPPALEAPLMLPAHLDAWVQTSPAPAIEPDVARWLHGIRDVEHDVHVVWRDDLHEMLLDPAGTDKGAQAVERVLARPPVSTEAMSLPIAAVRRWLLRQEPAQIADVEGVAPFADVAGDPKRKRPALRWAGSESTLIRPAGIQPGDTLVVPVQYGGIALGSWAPEARQPIHQHDIAAIASRAERRLAVVRLTRDRWPLLDEFAGFEEMWAAATAGEQRGMINDALVRLRDAPSPWSDRDDIADILEAPHRLRAIRLLHGVEHAPQDNRAARPLDATPPDPASPFGPTVVITAPVRSLDGAPGIVPIPLAVAGDDDDEMSSSGRSATLADHLSGVARWVQEFSERLGIDPEVAADVCLAAELHDIGKVDARFQIWLLGGDELAQAGATEPLAKSATPYYDRAERAAARDASGYPPGARHELASVAMVAGTDALRAWAHDPELVLHLVASHHGYCRGFAPVVRDSAPVTVAHTHDGVTLQASSAHGLERIDAGIAERFWRVVGRYGWFGVAWLETILRLADHRRSEQEPGVGTRS